MKSHCQSFIQLIEQTGYFLIKDADWINHTWTHNKCIDRMKATDSELNENQSCAGLSGFNRIVSSDLLNILYNSRLCYGTTYFNCTCF